MGADVLSELPVDRRNRTVSLDCKEAILAGVALQLLPDLPLVDDEGFVQVIRQGQVQACLPVAYCIGFLELTLEGDFRADIQQKRQVRLGRHAVDASEVVSFEASHDSASDQGVN